MGQNSKKKKCIYSLTALGISSALFLILAAVWDFYFDLNDDFLMENLLSGKFAGEPLSRNIQSLYPLSLVLSLFYRLTYDAGAGGVFGAPSFDWYGLFLILMYVLSLFLVLRRVITNAGEGRDRNVRLAFKAAGVFGIVLLYGAVLLYHLVFIQYSLVVGVMSASAGFLFLTGRETASVKDFLKENISSFILLFTAYLLRSEMVLFMVPFAGLCVVFRAFLNAEKSEKPVMTFFSMTVSAAMVLVIIIGTGEIGDRIGYRSDAWKEFDAFFDARTTVYDFETPPEYEGNENFYDSLDMDSAQAELLINYNFGIDEAIDSGVMEQIAVYEKEKMLSQTSVSQRLKEALWVYRYQKLFGAEEQPYNMISFTLYGLVFLGAVFSFVSLLADKTDKKAAFFCLIKTLLAEGLLFAARSSLWIYLLYSQRPVERLTHSMYFAECLILLTLLFMGRRFDITTPIKAVFAAVIMGLALSSQIADVNDEYARREDVNVPYEQLISYAADHQDAFFFIDVYSTVDFSEKMFDNYKVTAANIDYAGGWASKSPAEKKKFDKCGIASMEDALINDGTCCFVQRSDYDTAWLEEYYKSCGVNVMITEIDNVGEYWSVYKLDTWDGVTQDTSSEGNE